MTEWIRQWKWTYALYNLFHKQELRHLEALYRQYGIRKRYYEPVCSADFDHLPAAREESIEPDVAGLQQAPVYAKLPEASRQSLQQYPDKGYALLRGWLQPAEVERANAAVAQLLEDDTLSPRYNNKKLMFAIHHSDFLRRIGHHPDLKTILGYLLDGQARLFQSINFVGEGSEQKTHSDSIHMTTFPLGGLLGVWIALDEVGPDNGPLHYYPGSHRLPYFLNDAFGNQGTRLRLGDKGYPAYEAMIEQKVQEYGLAKETLRAQPGDLLIWHANLLHGGEPHRDKSRSRRSMVLHYFKEGYICYHEISQRPALLKA